MQELQAASDSSDLCLMIQCSLMYIDQLFHPPLYNCLMAMSCDVYAYSIICWWYIYLLVQVALFLHSYTSSCKSVWSQIIRSPLLVWALLLVQKMQSWIPLPFSQKIRAWECSWAYKLSSPTFCIWILDSNFLLQWSTEWAWGWQPPLLILVWSGNETRSIMAWVAKPIASFPCRYLAPERCVYIFTFRSGKAWERG